LVYFMNIWYILWTFGTFCGNLVHFSRFWNAVPWKIWQPCSRRGLKMEGDSGQKIKVKKGFPIRTKCKVSNLFPSVGKGFDYCTL
jgi:hypothetical protein